MHDYADLKQEYASQWSRMVVLSSKQDEVDRIARRLLGFKDRYMPVSTATGVPWYFIAVLHQRESDADFSTHLHNGDPLTGRTYHVPAGRPKAGHPPFTWQESAIDAMSYEGLDQIKDWCIERMAWAAEKYNGWGYRSHGVPSAYLWSFSNIYKGGKYVADGEWDSGAMDRQCGVMPILGRMQALGGIKFPGEAGSAKVDEKPASTTAPEPIKPISKGFLQSIFDVFRRK